MKIDSFYILNENKDILSLKHLMQDKSKTPHMTFCSKSIKIYLFDSSLDEYLTETTHGLWVLLTRLHNVTAVSALSSSSLGLEPHSDERQQGKWVLETWEGGGHDVKI